MPGRDHQQALVAAVKKEWCLTPAEARSVSALATGRSTQQIATDYAISIHTVRTQLKRAMVKAGAHSQSALVASVYTLLHSPAGRGNGAKARAR